MKASTKKNIIHNNTKIDEYLSKNIVNEEETNHLLSSKINDINDELLDSISLKQRRHVAINKLVNISVVKDFDETIDDNNYKFVANKRYFDDNKTNDVTIATNFILNNLWKNILDVSLELDPNVKKINNLSCKIIKMNTGNCDLKTNYLPNSVEHLITKDTKNIMSHLNNSIVVLNLDKVMKNETIVYARDRTHTYTFKKMPVRMKKIHFNKLYFYSTTLRSNKKYKKILHCYMNYIYASDKSDSNLFILFIDDYNYDEEKDLFIKN